jgi:hypothetical protein
MAAACTFVGGSQWHDSLTANSGGSIPRKVAAAPWMTDDLTAVQTSPFLDWPALPALGCKYAQSGQFVAASMAKRVHLAAELWLWLSGQART